MLIINCYEFEYGMTRPGIAEPPAGAQNRPPAGRARPSRACYRDCGSGDVRVKLSHPSHGHDYQVACPILRPARPMLSPLALTAAASLGRRGPQAHGAGGRRGPAAPGPGWALAGRRPSGGPRRRRPGPGASAVAVNSFDSISFGINAAG